MPTVDALGTNTLASHHAEAFFVWINFVGDPLRATTFGQDVPFSGTGDSDLDGNTFVSLDGSVVEVGTVNNSDGGSDTLTIDLSGIPSIDAATMAEIADTTKWRGVTVRLWMQIYDETGESPRGAIVPYYTGYASSVKVLPTATTQTIRLEVENYLAIFNQASNRDYLNQKDYDSADNSAQATLAAANMGRGAPSAGGGGGGFGAGMGLGTTFGLPMSYPDSVPQFSSIT